MNIFEKLTALPSSHNKFMEDFDRRFLGGFLLIESSKFPGTYEPCLVHQRYDDHSYTFASGTQKFLINLFTHKGDVKVFLPEPGYYNTSQGVIHIEQSPDRQWKRTLCKGTYKLASIGNLNIPVLNAHLCEDLYTPIYPKLDDLQPRKTYALSRNLCVKSNSDDKSILYYRTIRIGSLNFNTRTIELTQPVLEQEIKDLLKRTGATKWNFQLIPKG